MNIKTPTALTAATAVIFIGGLERGDDASFFARKPGTTTAWVSGPDGQRVSFDITVATS